MSYVNDYSGTTKGPIQLQFNGPWLVYQTPKHFSYDANGNPIIDTNTQLTKEEVQHTLSIVRTIGNNYEKDKNSTGMHDSIFSDDKNDLILKLPFLDTGWHKVVNTDKEVPNIGWHAVPTVQWVVDYCQNYVQDPSKIRVDVSTLADKNFVKEEDDKWYQLTKKEYMIEINKDRTEIDNLQEVCNNIYDDIDATWIIDGSTPLFDKQRFDSNLYSSRKKKPVTEVAR